MPNAESDSGFSLKDHLFNQDRVRYLAGLFHAANPAFDAAGFVRDTMKELTELELKERIVHIAVNLERYLPADFSVAAKHVVAALPAPLDPSKSDDDFGDFIFAPLGEFVVRNGLSKKHLPLSLKTLKAITQRFSMEDAIRAFINAFEDETLRELGKWATDRHYHVRRLVSEGTRPLLPWSKRLRIDASAAIPLLDSLHADPTRFVTRSVSNHLNDIAKTDPAVVVQTLEGWQKLGMQRQLELQWMSKHALRTLIKQGDARALQFLGFKSNPKIEVTDFALVSTCIKPGQAIEFSFTIRALRDESLLVDFVIDFMKANGQLSPRVHKLKQVDLKKNQSTTISKRHVLKANATTYRLYPGLHRLTLQINGCAFAVLAFELLK